MVYRKGNDRKTFHRDTTRITTLFFLLLSGQVVGCTLALELQHDVQSHLMDPSLVNENQTSQKCALVHTLFPGA